MKEQLAQLREFQTKFRSIVNNKPTLLEPKDCVLRYDLSKEELYEYAEACKNNDIVEIADAIVDRLFLALGDAVAHGLDEVLPELFQEVVESNMSKLDDNGNPIINGENGVNNPSQPLGKILKSEKYFKPKIKEILERYYGSEIHTTSRG